MVQLVGDMHEKMKKLKQSYLNHLPDKIQDAQGWIEKLVKDGGNTDALQNIRRIFHSIKGSSASFGYPDITTKVLAVETIINNIGPDSCLEGESLLELRTTIVLLEHSLVLHKETSPEQEIHFAAPFGEGFATSKNKLIYIAEDDEHLLQKLSMQLSQFGYRVKAFSHIEALSVAVAQECPAVIIMDIIFPDDHFAGINAIKKLQQNREKPLSVIFISSRNDIDARLHAVRAGASAYFVKPLNISELIDNLDNLTQQKEVEPYKILIVDDEPELASYHALILQNAGMKTAIVTEPLKIMETLSKLNPDLILMDMYMPDCSGKELSKVIRQTGTYFSIPIVFLSAETNLDKQIAAVNTGADDFLTKPIRPDHLISSVIARAERLRIIRSFMDKDSLTGLLNHSKSKEQLDIAISRAKRQKNNLAFAIIDIDKFKIVNDTYGHPIGDDVLVVLSRFLKQRLRKSDIIGRYGGEEFVLILSEIMPEAAEIVFNRLRVSFSKIKYRAEDKEFSVNFSCGFAMLSDYDTPTTICYAADKALYRAKHKGRDCVIRA